MIVCRKKATIKLNLENNGGEEGHGYWSTSEMRVLWCYTLWSGFLNHPIDENHRDILDNLTIIHEYRIWMSTKVLRVFMLTILIPWNI